MKTNYKIYILLVALIASMFYWINKTHDTFQRILSFLIIALLAYGIGRFHSKRIYESNAHHINDDTREG